jgi:amino acid adenylation domain-containing protein
MAEPTEISEQKRKLLEEYLRQRSEAPRAEDQILRREPSAVIPLTLAQQQVWLHAQLAPEVPVYNEPFTVHRTGSLDVGALERSLNEIIRRHEAWRTTFAVFDGQPVQVVHPPFEIKLEVDDLRDLPKSERVAEALRLATEDACRPFNLAKLPLLRARLVRLAQEEYRIFVNCHHLIFDGISGYQVFLPELSRLYRAFSDPRAASSSSVLPELLFQYGDFALWQRQRMQGDEARRRIEYWRRQLGGNLPVLQLPTDRSRTGAESFRGAMQTFVLSRDLSDGLRLLSQRHGVTLFMTLLAALDTLLYRYSGQEDIIVGSITAGRNRSGTEKLLGFFLNTVVLRTNLSGNPTFSELLDRVRKTTIDALSNDGVPLDEILRELHPDRSLERNPLFRVLLSLEPSLSEVESGWNLTSIDVGTSTSKFDLCLVLDDRSDGLSGRLIYSTDLFDASTVANFVECWRTLLQSVVAKPEEQISRVAILPHRERHKLLVEFNQTEAANPLVFAHKRFELQAKKTPNVDAVKCGDRVLSYRELDERANKLAHHLRNLGVTPNALVALSVERSLEMVVGILGILKAGGAYVPLDPAYPKERLEFMLSDCGAGVLLTQSHLPSLGLSSNAMRVVCLDTDWGEIEKEPAADAVADLVPGNLAYVIYTSGSTGGPKGVQITHGNLAHSTAARVNYYAHAGGSFLLLSSFAFDSSVAAIFHPLCVGASLTIPNAEFNSDGRQIAELVFENKISNILCIPSLYGQVLETGDNRQLASLRIVIVAGESCSQQLVAMHYRTLPDVELFNEYGPTEATVWSTVYRCQREQQFSSVPIGRPIANTQLYVLDRNLQLVPNGIPGELYIAGAGVARGYLNRPELTQKKFLPLPFGADSDERMYRTGDQVRWLGTGDLQFLGRIDEQVKIRGMRIELGEIETTLSNHPDVRESVVAVERDQRLVAHVVMSEQFATSAAELGAFLKSQLPSYMVPSAFRFVSQLPRTPNGKVDRRALTMDSTESVESSLGSADVHAAEPRDSIESRLLVIWKEVLGIDSADVTQDFFQLGGHSMLAAKLLYRIEQVFNQPLSLAFVFQAPTIELMADWLRSPNQSLRARTIIEIQTKGSQPPLFWVRAGPRFRLLAEKLGLDQPFLGVDIPYADAIKLPTPYRIEDIASFLVRAMREVQPQGPYFLAGLCVNAVIAYEMARQLNQQGEELAMLAMFDAHNQAYYRNPLRDGRYTGRIKYHLANLIHSDIKEGSSYLLARFEEARRKMERTLWQFTSDQGSNSRAGKMHNADAIVHPAFHRYEPGAYSGKMVLFQSSDWPKGDYFDFALGWKDLIEAGIDFHRIPGDHPSMFTEPNVGLVATNLREDLKKARRSALVTDQRVAHII